MRNCFLFITIFFFNNLSSFALSDHYIFNQISINDGLSTNNITNIIQDSIGFIWFGSENGLNRFDGYEVKRFFFDENDSSSLSSNFIHDIFIDNSGRLWIGTTNGVSRYNYQTSTFNNYNLLDHSEDPGYNIATSFGTDMEGHVWVCSQHGELYQFNERNSVFERYHYQPLVNFDIQSIKFDKSNILWMGFQKGLGKLDINSSQFKFYPFETSISGDVNIKDILVNEEYIWAVAYKIGIHKFDTQKNEYKKFKFDDAINNLFLSGYKDLNDNLWFASSGGLFKYDRDKKEVQRFVFSTNEINQLINKGVQCIYQDVQGSLWIGTTYDGVIQLTPGKGFTTYDSDYFSKLGRKESVVNSFEEIGDEIWIGFTQGVDIYSKDFHFQNRFTPFDSNIGSIGNGDIWDIFEDSKGRIWIGSYLGGLQLFNERDNTFVNFSERLGIQGEDVRSITEDKNGDLWFSIHGYGICHLNPETGEFKIFNATNHNLSSDWTFSTLVDINDYLWVGTVSGLSRINTIDYTVQNYKSIRGNHTSLSDNRVRVLFEDNDGGLWIGTDRGLSFYSNDSFIRLTIENGLRGNIIMSIKEDENGYLWIGTGRGELIRFDKTQWKVGQTDISNLVKVFDRQDGLQSKEFRTNASLNTDNKLYFGGVNGVTSFDANEINFNKEPPKVIISDFLLFNQAVVPGERSFLKESIFVTDVLKLSYNQDVLTFKFTAFNYIQPHKNSYAYKLEGFDNQWYYIGNKREITYTNLPAGEYTLKVKASNNDGYWNEKGTMLKLIIIPPWWGSIWFRFVLVVIFILLLYTILWLRTKNIHFQKKLLTNEVEKKTARLERQNIEIKRMAEKVHEADESKIRFFLNVSHEFKTPLTLINGSVETLMLNDSSQEKQRLYAYIKNGADKLLNLINELLDLRKIEVNKKLLQVHPINLMVFLEKVMETYEYLAQHQNINLKLILPTEKINPIWVDLSILDKVINNLLTNAFKYTPEGGEVIVKVGFEDYNLVLNVIDTGMGMSAEVQSKIFDRFYSFSKDRTGQMGSGIGLTIVKELISLHKGSISVSSKLGKGTVFTVTLPVSREVYANDEVKSEEPKIADSEEIIYKASKKEESNFLFSDESNSYHEVLIVEDNVELKKFLKESLSPYYNIHTANNGRAALEKLKNLTPDLILCDIMMPEMNGMEFLESVKNDDLISHIPIIMLTAKSEVENIIEGYDVGADDYITKPFNISVLKSRINNLIIQRHKLRSTFEGISDIKPKDFTEDKTDEKFLERAIRIVEKNISDQSLGYQQFAKEMGLSKSKLYSKIGKITGQSINVFIRTIRLKVAAKKILESDVSISQLAYEVGFNDSNYFSKSFKAFFGVSPSEYKEKAKKNKSI